MNKNIIENLIKFSSSTLVISYFIIHNIILVFIGMAFSFYLVNKNPIQSFMKFFMEELLRKLSDKVFSNTNKAIKIDSMQNNINRKDSPLTLVETIEELGFIPSLDNDNDSNAA